MAAPPRLLRQRRPPRPRKPRQPALTRRPRRLRPTARARAQNKEPRNGEEGQGASRRTEGERTAPEEDVACARTGPCARARSDGAEDDAATPCVERATAGAGGHHLD